MDKLLYNAYRFSSANSARIENGNGKNNVGAVTSDGRYGFDCSGFVNYVVKNSGYKVDNYTSTAQTVKADGSLTTEGAKWQQTINTDQARQGDLVYFQGHVGIVVSYDNKTGVGIFRSSTSSYGVTDAPFTTAPQNGLTYWGTGGKQFVGFTRVTAVSDRDKDIWRSSTDTSTPPPLESAPALPTTSNPNPSGYASSWLTQTAWIESRGAPKAYDAQNGNALGKYQMLEKGGALTATGYTDAQGNWLGKNGINSRADFLANGAEQERAAGAYVDVLRAGLIKNGAMDSVGKTIGGHLITEEGLLGAAWQYGPTGVKQRLALLDDPVDFDNVGKLAFLSRLDSFRGTLAPGMAGASVEAPTGGVAGSRTDPVVNTFYPGTGTATHHTDGSTTYEYELKADSLDGRYKKGDLVSISYDKDETNGTNFYMEAIWRADGTVYQRSLSADKTKETIVEWSKDNIKTRQITKDIATGEPVGEFIKDGQRYDASGRPVLPVDYAGPPPVNVNPYTLLDAIPAPLPTKDSSAQQVAMNWGSDNFGPADIDLSRLLQGTQVGYLPGAQIDTASKLEAEMIVQGYEVSRDENGIYASKGEQYFAFTSEAMIFQNGSQWAVVAFKPNGEMVSGSHLGVNGREMHVDIGGADTVLRGHLSGDEDDLGDDESDAFVIDQVISINGLDLPPDTYAIDPQDLEAYGFTFSNIVNGTLPASSTGLIEGLNPGSVAASGWSPPQVMVTDLANGGSQHTLELGNGLTLITLRDSDRRAIQVTEIQAKSSFESTANLYQVNGDGTRTLLTTTERLSASDGSFTALEIDRSTQAVRKITGDVDGNTTSVVVQQPVNAFATAAQTAVDLIQFGQLLATNAPGAIKLANGAVLLNKLSTQNGQPLFSAGTGQVLGGIVSLYSLSNAWKYGDGLAKTSATLNSLNFVNQTLISNGLGSTALNTTLNGTGLLNGTPGVLPALGLISAIKAEDPIGMAQSAIALFNPALLYSAGAVTPLGWVLIGASILQSLFSDDSPPDAWGVANVTFGPGITNYLSQVNATGENFGPERVRGQLQGTLDALNGIINQANSSNPDSTQHLGLIPQRLPSLNYRAAEFADKGYSVTDIDALTGAQRAPFLRFDDQGRLFGALPEQMTPEVRAMLYLDGASNVPALTAYMLNSALDRQAIAPMWEVKTARMQQEAGDPNAGLTEEERAAKAGHAAPLDAAYAAAHTNDPQARNKRQGHFMAVGLDLNGDGRIETRSIAQNAAAGTDISFDWDGQGYQKKTGWIGAQDGFLMLDHNFNQSADNAKELLSNPLIADAGKGLRTLAAYDANGDGRIDQNDPVYQQLKVWQDLNQDGNNTQVITVGSVQALAQDETGGQKELKSLQEAGISAIDYGNGRYEFNSASSANGVGYGQIATQTLEAESEGTRYTPVGAGIQIELSNGTPQIVITQVLSEQAVYQGLQIAASGETIGVPGAELYEDGLPYGYNPNTQGGQREIVISAAQLLANDTWAGMAGVGAGLAITHVRAGAHTSVSLRADGDISLRLESNYHGAAEFFYTVVVPGQQAVVAPQEARVTLDITAVNDAPVVTNSFSPERAIYGYFPLGYQYVEGTGWGENSSEIQRSGAVRGGARYEPYVELIPPVPIYERILRWSGEDQYYENVIIGYTQEQYVPHYEVIATDKPNTGRVIASDPDGGSFTYQLLGQPLYGTASLDGAGNWSYTGRRPEGYLVPDVNGDGAQDLLIYGTVVSVGDAPLYGYPNIDSNRYAPDERTFLDYFSVRVYDNTDPTGQTFKDVEIAATHYGPPPHPTIADSGGGKKPIAIDLDGNGFHFTDVDDSNVFFDVNGDGWKRRMAWTSPGDGLLAFDKDGDGKITSFDEISFVPYAPDQQTDLAALKAAFDTNHDGVFNTNDEKWTSFGVWQDANSNGLTDAGEFKTLSDMGITGINLSNDGQFRVIDAQTVHGLGMASKADGGTLAVADVTLRYKNETLVTTVNPDGSTTTSTASVPTYVKGQEFIGTPDKDLVFGTQGSDHFVMLEGDDVIVDDGGNDAVEAGDGNDLIYTGKDNDIVVAGAGNDTVFAGAGNDLVFGDGENEAGDDLIMMEDGNDVAFGGAGNDFVSGGLGNDVLSGNAGDDKLFGEDGWDALFGQKGDDELWGGVGNDLLDGGAGNDLLLGGAGDDTMEGGTGDDTYEVDSAGDVVIEVAGEGLDTVNASISYTLADTLENLILAGQGNLSGMGNAADNVLVGNDGNNTLTGMGGNDVLDGGLGADLMYGGTGDDTYVIDHAGDQIVEAAGEGTDTVRSRISTTLTANTENLTLVGINAINGTGNDLGNVLVGNIAANVLDGGAGADVMRGGRGNDLYIVDDVGDMVMENAGEGTDTVHASVSYTLSANVENLTLTGNAIAASGNELANILQGNAQANVLDGAAGADVMMGNAGDDTYHVDQVGDAVIEAAGEGIDTVVSTIDYTLGTHLENLTLAGNAVNATGNSLNNVLIGNARANWLDGAAGADQMAGSAGDDTYVIDDVGDGVVELADEGSDTVLASVSYSLTANVENLTLTGSADTHATGNDLDNVITGNSGANRIDGGTGADQLSGGAGNDIYVVDNAADSVVELADEGIDTVLSSVSYNLSANVENLTLTGAADISATGNELDNTLLGNAGANALDGATGADVMAGGAGDDTYVVDNAGDTVVEASDEGMDTVLASVSYSLSTNVENLTLMGVADIDAIGNDLANALTGNIGANTLDGAAGADAMAGGAGDDTYVVDNVLDTVTEQAGEGVDTVLSSVSYTLSSNVENLTLTGAADIDATGNALNNMLTGNGGNNLLDGSLGADAMAGAAGDDTYVVDDGGDMVTEWLAAGMDTVLAGINYVLPQHVENLRLTGNAITATGNALDNQLYGNALDNLIDGDAGADQLVGAAGNDTYVVDNAGDTVVELAAEGKDTVLAGVSYGLSDNVENLALTGAADLAATGNTLNNVILGNTGNNLIDGGMGADVMAGGVGNDRYIVDDVLDIVTEAAAEGVDTIEASVSYTLSSQVENLALTGAAVQGTGNDLDNRLTGNAQDNLLDGAIGADAMAGGAGNDTYVVDNTADTVEELAGEGKDTVLSSVSYTLSANVENLTLTGSADISAIGNELDNILTGNAGNNALAGGTGNDTYVYTVGGGLDTILDTSGVDTVSFGPGLTLENVALRIATVNGQKVAQIRVLDATGNEIADQGIDYVMPIDAQGRLGSPLENFVFADGSSYGWGDLLIQSTSLTGTNGADLLIGGRNDDSMFGRNDRDVLYGGSGHDQLFGENGDDILFGGGGSDKLYGGSGDDELHGEAGNDLLDGGNGKDLLIDLWGNNTFYAGNDDDTIMAGAGNDTIYADNGSDLVQTGAGSDVIVSGNENDLVDAGTGDDNIGTGNSDDWIVAGKGNDVIDGGNGRNLYAFNRGDGADTLNNSGNGRDTISLGGSIRYADLSLAKAGNDLVLNVGQGDSMTIKNWYLGNNAKNVDKLQVVTVGGDYDANSADKTRNKQVEVFDFAKLVQKFDAARTANTANANGWAAMNSLLDAHLQGSNTAALGGDLSYQYATAGRLSGIGLGAAQSSLAAGTDWQNLKSRSQLAQGSVRLM
ncbi:NlpC/P60 family protein [Polaromonas jejuensis]|uniref:NlpC/P60 family protein n=1 Tax=Polaromonas jejuensis TaxID=457502 RepID=A0ABW0QA61_9BURK|nr:NlpC/P60 family protein [Polaromonas jejuensis]